MTQNFDDERFYLGKLCKRGHDWNTTGKSLRVKSHRMCIECRRENDRQNWWKPERHEKRLKQMSDYGKRRRKIDPEFRAQKRENHRAWRRRTNGHIKLAKKYRDRHREAYRLQKRLGEARRRARKHQAGGTPFTPSQLKQHLQHFDSQCVYCGATGKTTIDHLTPIAKGGRDELANIVPACPTCNLHKQAQDAYEWYSSQPFFDQIQWENILKTLKETLS